MKTKEKVCELCDQPASLYCASDSAFLCWKCDDAVHRANFLVARHSRRLLCSSCNRFAGINVSGATPFRAAGASPICRCCSPPENHCLDDVDSLRSSPSSESSACASSPEPRTAEKKIKSRHATLGKRVRTTRRSCSSSVTDEDGGASSVAKRRRRTDGGSEEEDAMFVKWRSQLGLGLNDGRSVSSLASRALSLWLGKWKGVVPLRVSAATSFWFGLRFCGMATFQNLWRLERVSGVPAKLILTAHVKLARVFFDHQHLDLEEGCDES